MSHDYFGKYLEIAPFALALWRDQEAAAIATAYETIKRTKKIKFHPKKKGQMFKPPVLDVGCGFGEFAGVFIESQIEVGVDISVEDLIRAEKQKKYLKLIAADARKLPFQNESFSTVLSVSVLEHIAKPELSMKEIYRVLKPKGLFIFTVPTIDLNNYLFYPVFFRRVGFPKLADIYLRSYHRAFKHVNIISPKSWTAMATKIGFKIMSVQGTFSARLVKFFDLSLLTALPSQISRWLLGTRWIWGLQAKRKVLDPLYKNILSDQIMTQSNILVIAEK